MPSHFTSTACNDNTEIERQSAASKVDREIFFDSYRKLHRQRLFLGTNESNLNEKKFVPPVLMLKVPHVFFYKKQTPEFS